MPSVSGNNFKPLDFSTTSVEGNKGTSGSNSENGVGSSGICGNFEGLGVILTQPLTREDHELLESLQFRGTPLPLAEQMLAGLDPEKMDALIEECNSGQLSVNDLATELMMLMLNNAFENKSIERQMRAELAQIAFQNGMKAADMTGKKGELAYKKAAIQAVTKMASVAVDIATSKVADYIANQKKPDVAGIHAKRGGGDRAGGFKYTPDERKAIKENWKLGNEALKAAIETTGSLMCADIDLEMSKIDAQKQAAEATGKLIDSIASSVDSSIRAQDQAIQFAMSMLEKINSLAHDIISKIVNNIR
ncbi:MAG: hypothetical protein LBJ71_04280 [Holosporaceae bacterium]|jgi:hypothetical protein|nr:hypothetical protein [Holosporaceae bacterium]